MKRPLKRPKKLIRKSNFRLPPYLRINLILSGIILLVFLYSGIFSAEKDNYPVPSFYERITGLESPSRGLSRSFSEIIRGRFDMARSYNASGIPIFAFFFIQLLMRLSASLLILRSKCHLRIIGIADIAISILLFVFFFRKLLYSFLLVVVNIS